jgi:hypothetical protein
MMQRPDIWAQGVGRQFKAFGDSKYLAKYIVQPENKEAAKMAVTRMHMVFNNSEFMKGAATVEKIPFMGKSAKPFERAFSGFLDTTRLELVKAWTRPGMSDKELAAIGRHIDNMMGTMDMAKIGIGPNQKLLETILFFAPRYTRSHLAFNLNAMRGLVSGQMSARMAMTAMARYQAAQHALYYAAAEITKPLTGEGAHINPADPHYMSFKINDHWVRFGGGFQVTYNKVAARVTKSLAEGDLTGAAIHLSRYIRGKSSALMQIPIDLAFGKDFIGRTVVDKGVLGFIKESILEGATPFWIQTMFFETTEDDTWADKITRGALEIWGFSAYRVPAYDEYLTELDKMSNERHGVDAEALWSEHPTDYLRLVNDPSLQGLKAAADQESMAKGAGRDKSYRQYIDRKAEVNIIEDAYEIDIINAVHDLKVTGDIKAYREAVKAAKAERGGAFAPLEAKYPNAFEWMRDRDWKENLPEGAAQELVWYEAYQNEIRYNPNLYERELKDEEYFDLHDKNTQTFIDQYGREAYEKAKSMFYMSKGYPDEFITTEMAMDTIATTKDPQGRNYWDISMSDMPQEERQSARHAFLYNHPEVEASLYTMGYISTLQTAEAHDHARLMIEDLGIDKSVPLPLDRRNREAQRQIYQERINEAKSAIGRGDWGDRTPEEDALWSRINSIRDEMYVLEDAARNARSASEMNDYYLEMMDTAAKFVEWQGDLKAYEGGGANVNYLNALADYWGWQYETWVSRVNAFSEPKKKVTDETTADSTSKETGSKDSEVRRYQKWESKQVFGNKTNEQDFNDFPFYNTTNNAAFWENLKGGENRFMGMATEDDWVKAASTVENNTDLKVAGHDNKNGRSALNLVHPNGSTMILSWDEKENTVYLERVKTVRPERDLYQESRQFDLEGAGGSVEATPSKPVPEKGTIEYDKYISEEYADKWKNRSKNTY